MNGCRTMVLVTLGALFAGCAATAPERPGPTGPDDAEDRVVEAEGVARMGDNDTLAEVRERAEAQAIERAVQKGFGVGVKEWQRTEFGVLFEDVKTSKIAGTLVPTEFKDSFDGTQYRVLIRARVSDYAGPEPPDPEPPKVEPPPPDPPDPPDTPSGTTSAGGEDKVVNIVVVPPVVPALVTICCQDFTEVLLKRVPSVLEKGPGVTRVERTSATGTEVCYQVHHGSSAESLMDWIDSNLRTDKVRLFKLMYDRGAGRIDLKFDAGFN